MFLHVNENNLSFKDYLPLVSSSIVILLFITERILSYRIRKNEIKRNWYYKVAVDPTLEKMDIFFNESISTFKEAIDILSVEGMKGLTKNEFNKIKSNESGKFQEHKRSFDIEVITIVTSLYSKYNDSLTDKLNQFEDLFVEGLENYRDPLQLQNFIKNTHLIKSEMLQIIFTPIQ